MENTDSSKSVLILTGMHRSGTSLTASLLQNAGVNLGERLMGAGEGNVKGHFEDLDFVEFHQTILQSLELSDAGWTTEQSLQVSPQYYQLAKNLVATKKLATGEVWSWKDPRTTLFLDFWREIIPEAQFVFVYRSPWEVIDSLYRRGDVIFQGNPYFALQLWLSYNRAILSFGDRYPENSILFRIEDIISHPDFLINSLNEKFKLSLTLPQQLYDSSLFSQANSSHRPTIIKKYFPEAWNLYLELHRNAHIINSAEIDVIDDSSQFFPHETWFLKDWQENQYQAKQISQLQQQLQETQQQLSQSQQEFQEKLLIQEKLEFQLEDTQAQLQQTQTEWENTQAQLQQTQTEWENTQAQLQQTQTKWENTQAQLQQTQTEWENTQVKLQQTQTEWENTQVKLQQTQTEWEDTQVKLQQAQTEWENTQAQLQQAQTKWEQSQNIIKAMISSKFWKVRRLWFRLKRAVGLKIDEIII